MRTLTSYMTDTSFVEEVLSYLRAEHGVHAVVMDSDGGVAPIGDHDTTAMAEIASYPFDFHENIGSLQCSAENTAVLQKAQPHIRMCLAGINDLLQKELVLQQTTDEMLQLSEQLHFLLSLANKVIGVHDLTTYCTVILEEISRAIGADFAFVQTRGKWEKKLNVTHNVSREAACRLRRQEAFQSTPKEGTVILSLQDGTSALITPIKEKNGQIGYMAFFRNSEKRFFTAYEKQFVSIIDNIISPTIESLRLYDSLQELYLNTVRALAAAIDAKDEYTHGHSSRVAKYSVAIGKEMDISHKELTDLEVAAYMHDLGKIGVPEAILGKPGKLTPDEYEEIKKHPVLTNKILQPIDLPSFIVDAAVQHHERLDGGGYPFGLQGDNICFFAKIIAVADVFDALTSARPYRDAMTVEDALTILCDGIDKEFERSVVLAMISALKNDKEDAGLSELLPGLKFLHIHQMNQFLVHLTQVLLPEGGGRASQPAGEASATLPG